MFAEFCRNLESSLPDIAGTLFREADMSSGHPMEEVAHSTKANYYDCLIGIARNERPVRVCEIGTGFGLSALALLCSCNRLERFISLDLGVYWKKIGFVQNNIDFAREKIHSWCGERGIPFDRVRFYQANTQPPGKGDNINLGADVEPWYKNPELMRSLTGTDFDVIFIDGKHTEDGLYNDLMNFWPYVRQGGLVICDDLHDYDRFRDVFPWAGDTVSSFNRFLNEKKNEIADWYIWEYPSVDPDSHIGIRPFGLLRKKKSNVFRSIRPGFEMFDSPGAMAINQARQDHLASLNLPLHHRSVLEVGSGVGWHTGFFEKLGCSILSTEGRESNVREHVARYPFRKDRVKICDLNKPGSHSKLGTFEIVYCYGTLYHVEDPASTLRDLADVCTDILLLETCVGPGDNGTIHNVAEDSESANQSMNGMGCRPSRDWLLLELRKNFRYVYIPRTQPDHHEFPLKWPAKSSEINSRAIFIGSGSPLRNPLLCTELPDEQSPVSALFNSEWLTATGPQIVWSNHDLLRHIQPVTYGTRSEVIFAGDDGSLVFHPADSRDHLVTPIIPLGWQSPAGDVGVKISLHFSKTPENFLLFVQDSQYRSLLTMRPGHRPGKSSEEWAQCAYLDKPVSSIRIVIKSDDGRPVLLPSLMRVTLCS